MTARAGLLQLFYCTGVGECDAEIDAWQPFAAGAKICRVIDRAAASVPASPPPGFDPFPEHAVLGWQRFDDYPHPSEFPNLGLALSYDFSRMAQGGGLTATVAWPAGGVRFDAVPDRSDGPGLAEAISMAAPKDKLGGWPDWVQGAAYPSCPRCGGRMQYLLQIDSEDHVPYMFGDVGTGHITQCPTHPDVLAFAWACS